MATGEAEPRERRTSLATAGPWLGLVVAAVALRVVVLVFDHGTTLDSDEAVIGLMGRHILHLGERPVFFYGQEYMGAFEAYLAALAFALAGSSPATLKAVMVLLDVAMVLSFVWLARELWEKKRGDLAGWYAALPPTFLALYGLKARGGYVETLIAGNVLLAGAARLAKRRGPGLAWPALFLGLIAGLAFWTHTLVAVYFPVAAAVALVGIPIPARARALAAAAGGFIAGGWPLWWRNLHTGFASFGNLTWVSPSVALAHFGGFVSSALPVLVGARAPWAAEDVLPGARWVLLPLWAGALAYYARSVPREGADRATSWARTAPCAVGLLTVAGYAFSSYGAEAREPRYLIPLYTWLALAFAVVVHSAYTRWGRRALWLPVAALGFHLVGLLRQDPTLMLGISAGRHVARSNRALIALLDKAGVRSVYTDYWVAYRLAFETNERIRTSPFGHVVVERMPSMSAEVAKDPAPAFVLLGDAADGFRAALERRKLAFREREVAPYRVFLRVQDAEHVRQWTYPFR